MSASSKIEWTDATWNPVTGCTQVSPGCDNCYALRFAERWRGTQGHYFEHGFDVTLRPQMLGKPNEWHKPRLIFVNSMSDLFHKDVPDDFIDLVFIQMETTDRHVYQLLTKRPERMRRYMKDRYGRAPSPRHIWIGTSVESNAYAWRAQMLKEINAPIRFLSVEPMLGPVDKVYLDGIAWVIAGGESGPGHRPLRVEWVRDLRDRCTAGNVAFFFKQWHKGKTGRTLDGATWDETPQVA
jgi:protein gp37